jgi:CubicO group peptidase (beta-lactamase class C family)
VWKFDLLYEAMVPDRRTSSGEISAGEQVMVYRYASPYTADRRCSCSPRAFDTTLRPPRSQSAGEQLLDQSLEWRVRDLRRRRRQPVGKPSRFRVGAGRLVSTVDDLLAFGEMMLKRESTAASASYPGRRLS